MLLSHTPIGNTTVFPESAVVQVRATFPNGYTAQGTGTMVNQNTVLTAGEMVYSYSNGGLAKSIEVIAGRNGNSAPFGVAYSKQIETFNSFIADDKSYLGAALYGGDGDFGFISLDRNLGNYTGWLPVMSLSGAYYDVTKFGYDGSQMYRDTGPLNEYGPGSISGFAYWGWSTIWSMPDLPEETGSSLLVDVNGKWSIIGVQVAGGTNEGYAGVTTQTVINALKSFENAHPPTMSPSNPQPPTMSPSNPHPPTTPPSNPQPPSAPPAAAPNPFDEVAKDAQLLVESYELGYTGGVDAALMDFETLVLFNSHGTSPTALEQALINDIFADL